MRSTLPKPGVDIDKAGCVLCRGTDTTVLRHSNVLCLAFIHTVHPPRLELAMYILGDHFQGVTDVPNVNRYETLTIGADEVDTKQR